MKFVSLAVLALIGDDLAVKKAHAMAAAKNELQEPDYFDRSFEEIEAKQMAKQQLNINKWDGLIHAQNGKLIDPNTMKEVDTEISEVQLDESFSGEPIGIVEQRYGLIQTQANNWYDEDFERQEKLENSRIQVNKWDGLVHAANGKVYDQSGKEVAEQLVQKQKKDWCDSGIKGTDWCAQEEAKDLNERTKRQ